MQIEIVKNTPICHELARYLLNNNVSPLFYGGIEKNLQDVKLFNGYAILEKESKSLEPIVQQRIDLIEINNLSDELIPTIIGLCIFEKDEHLCHETLLCVRYILGIHQGTYLTKDQIERCAKLVSKQLPNKKFD